MKKKPLARIVRALSAGLLMGGGLLAAVGPAAAATEAAERDSTPKALMMLPNGERAAPPTQVQKPQSEPQGSPMPVAIGASGEMDAAPAAALQRDLGNMVAAADAPFVVVPAQGELKPPKPGTATNLAQGAMPADYRIELAAADEQQGMSGMGAASSGAPQIRVTVRDGQGEAVAERTVRYDPEAPRAWDQDLRFLLHEALNIEAAEGAPAAAIQSSVATLPELAVWHKTKDGEPLQVGSEVAFFVQSNRDGYLSLYDFSVDGHVLRVFPSKSQPVNFVQAQRTYRVPGGQDWLTLTGGAGKATLKGVLTLMPSNADTSEVTYKGGVMQVIPTHHPTLFADQDMQRFFELPESRYAEAYLSYEVAPAASE